MQLYLLPTQGGEDDGPDDHEDGLDEVSPDDGGEAPGHREQRGDGEQDQDGDVDGAVTLEPGGLRDEESARVQVSLGQQLDTLSPVSSAAPTDRDLGEDVEEQREHGEVDADPLAPEPEAEVLGHGEHAAGHVHRDEAPAQEDQVEDGLDSGA